MKVRNVQSRGEGNRDEHLYSQCEMCSPGTEREPYEGEKGLSVRNALGTGTRVIRSHS